MSEHEPRNEGDSQTTTLLLVVLLLLVALGGGGFFIFNQFKRARIAEQEALMSRVEAEAQLALLKLEKIKAADGTDAQADAPKGQTAKKPAPADAPVGATRAKVTTISAQDIVEKFDGKDAKVTTVEVTIEPGQSSPPHRHPGPVFGYVLEGDYEWAINDQPVKALKAGDTFYEPTMCLHRVSRNPSDKSKTRLLAVMLHPPDAKQLVIPEPAKKE